MCLDHESVSRAAAELFAESARAAVQARGWFRAALAGGQTPRRTYELLASAPFREGVRWDRVQIFWGDERCVPEDHPESNAGLARRALLAHVSIPVEQVYSIAGFGAPEAAAARYQQLLREQFRESPPRFDLVFLGLGEDGHVASLFPGHHASAERERWTAAVRVAGQGFGRVTLTAPVFNQAALIVFLVSGAAKAGILREVLEGPPDERRLPAQMIRPTRGEVHWLLDAAAASRLSRGR